MAGELLPIKVVLPNPDRHVRIQPGGSDRKVFGTVDAGIRNGLAREITIVANSLAVSPQDRASAELPSVAKVRLKPEALAKSHRPTRLLTQETCPVIGVGAFNELYVRATTRGLRRLREAILSDRSVEGVANISTIDGIQPVSVEDKLAGIAGPEGELRLERAEKIKIILFDHHDPAIDRAIEQDFVEYAVSAGFDTPVELDYAPGLKVWVLNPRNHSVSRLLQHRGVRSAGVVPRFFPLLRASSPISATPRTGLSIPQPGRDYPTVGIVDSGVSETCEPLLPWVIAADAYVTYSERNTSHGTFVGGLVAFGSVLNAAGVVDSGEPCQIVDVIAIPNDDATLGDVGTLDETQLVAILREVVPKFKDRVKVWNLSLGSEEICTDHQFSDLGKALDALQSEHGVQFVIAAGNYEDVPFRSWPSPPLGESDRICSPADSVLGVTVGALAQAQAPNSVVPINHPSPFSRRGPGPAYGVKPELVHYGGNCDPTGGFLTTGMRSLFTDGRDAEDIGTSFATPIVSSLLSNVFHSIQPPPTPQLAKALVIHAAEYPLSRSAGDANYFGFGKASSLGRVLFATQSSATLIFEDVLIPGHDLELDPFPFPACLSIGGRSRGRIKMTLVYSPPLDANYGLEYCRANVTASLGTVGSGPRGNLKYTRQAHPDAHHSRGATEEDLIKHGLKWWPTKRYSRDIVRGIDSVHWRLTVDLLHRAGDKPQPQPFALIVTIEGNDDDPVYDDLVTALRPYASNDLALRASVRQSFRI